MRSRRFGMDSESESDEGPSAYEQMMRNRPRPNKARLAELKKMDKQMQPDVDAMIAAMGNVGIAVRNKEELSMDNYQGVQNEIISVSEFQQNKGPLTQHHFATDDGSVGPLRTRNKKDGSRVVVVEAPRAMTGRTRGDFSDETLHFDPQRGFYIGIISMSGGQRRLFRVFGKIKEGSVPSKRVAKAPTKRKTPVKRKTPAKGKSIVSVKPKITKKTTKTGASSSATAAAQARARQVRALNRDPDAGLAELLGGMGMFGRRQRFGACSPTCGPECPYTAGSAFGKKKKKKSPKNKNIALKKKTTKRMPIRRSRFGACGPNCSGCPSCGGAMSFGHCQGPGMPCAAFGKKRRAPVRRAVRLTKKMSKVIGTKREVYLGKAHHTKGGLRKSQILRVAKRGQPVRYISKKKSVVSKKSSWAQAIKKARARLIKQGVLKKGEFTPIGGKTAKGKKLLKLAREIYEGKTPARKTPARKTTTRRKTPARKTTTRRKCRPGCKPVAKKSTVRRDQGRAAYFGFF